MTIIQKELTPIEYTSPGPPTKPKPLKVEENSARETTIGPKPRPAMKKSLEFFVRRMAHRPVMTQKIM